jgi:ribosomal protein S18 acetylase RimI-like enzyme
VWTTDDYCSEIERSDSIFLVAKGEDQIVGFILARLIITKPIYHNPTESFPPDFEKTNNFISDFETEIEIYNIAVTTSFRRSSVGSKLLEGLFDSARQIGAYKIHLEVRKSNAGAICFYRKHGFEIVGERKNFYFHPVEDALLMCRLETFEEVL